MPNRTEPMQPRAETYAGTRYNAGSVPDGLLRTAVTVGTVASLTLTFFHPVMWLAAGLFLGLAVLLLMPSLLTGVQTEPLRFHFAAIWIFAVALLALAQGATHEFYNVRQIGFLIIGFAFGYLISLVRVPALAAWTPFALLATYFAALAMMGQDPAESLTQNSRNYVSAMLLALFASAMLLTKPQVVQKRHIVPALIVLTLSIWATGRAGIICALLLTAGLSVALIFRGRLGVLRSTLALAAVLALAVATFAGSEILQQQGYLDRLSSRGLRDPSRLAIIVSYFYQIEVSELIFGKNYYHDPFMQRWGYNLHNSFLSAWAHLGLGYLLFLFATMAICVRRLRTHSAIAVSVLAFGLRALTDTHLFAGQYDFIAFAAVFGFLRETPVPASRPSLVASRS